MNARFGKLIRCIQRVQQLQRGGWTLQWRVKLQLQKKRRIITKWYKKCYKVGQFFYYKTGQLLLQSGIGSFIAKGDNFIRKWEGCYKVGELQYKVEQLLQSGP